MALPIILNKPYLLVTLANSPSGIVTNGETTLVFGLVNMIYATCDKVRVNDYVLFNQAKADSVMYGSTIYYLVDEAFSIFKEETPP
jgi:hypothetical protein